VRPGIQFRPSADQLFKRSAAHAIEGHRRMHNKCTWIG
jgi:hypothetical protein